MNITWFKIISYLFFFYLPYATNKFIISPYFYAMQSLFFLRYYRMFEATQDGLGRNAPVHSIHGSLLAVGELLRLVWMVQFFFFSCKKKKKIIFLIYIRADLLLASSSAMNGSHYSQNLVMLLSLVASIFTFLFNMSIKFS